MDKKSKDELTKKAKSMIAEHLKKNVRITDIRFATEDDLDRGIVDLGEDQISFEKLVRSKGMDIVSQSRSYLTSYTYITLG